MNIVSVEKDKDTRVVSFDETGKILSVSSIEPAEDNLLFAHFKLTDIVPFMTGDKKLSDYLVSKTKDPKRLIYMNIRRLTNPLFL